MVAKNHDEIMKLVWIPLTLNAINTVLLIFLAFINFGLNKNVEKFKINESFISEFNKIRAEKIGESWAEINEWEAQISMALEHFKKYMDTRQKQDSIFATDLIKKTTGYETLFKIEKNRFWIGEKQYNLLGDFATVVARKQDNYIRYNQDSIRIINDLIHKKRLEAEVVLQELLNGTKRE